MALGAAALLFLISSLFLPWFGVPDAAPGVQRSPLAIIAREAPASAGAKLLLAIALAATAIIARRTTSLRRPAIGICAALLALLFFYPHSVMVWCPATAARAAWLYAQHTSLTWSGGDIWTSGAYKSFDWKSRVNVPDVLDQLGVMHTPALGPVAFPFGTLRGLLDWLGYSNPFCLFVRAGWGLAIGGCLLGLGVLCRGPRGVDVRHVVAAARICCGLFAVTFAICLLPALLCAFQVARARSAAERGMLAVSLARLESAVRLVPMIRENGDVVGAPVKAGTRK